MISHERGIHVLYNYFFLCVFLDKDGMKMAPFLKLFEPREYVDLLMMVSLLVLYIDSPSAASAL
jgi:hypothetical protein